MKTRIRSTTILAVRAGKAVAMGGDGQVTLNQTVIKHDARKIRRIAGGAVLAGFAGATADAFALLERFEAKLKNHPGNLLRAAGELAREWRTDRALRRLESLLAVADSSRLLLLSGTGDVIEPDDGIIGIGSGGAMAVAAARALIKHSKLDPEKLVREALEITGEICVYTNNKIYVEVL